MCVVMLFIGVRSTALVPRTTLTAPVTAMPPVHENMHQGTCSEEDKREPAEEMGTVLGEKVEGGNGGESPEYPAWLSVRSVVHKSSN